jgi:prepilin peptidase CpaA
VIAFAITVGLGDLWWRKIPRQFTTAGLLIGLGYHLWQGGFWSALAAGFIAFAVGLALFQLGAIGGGDVKLITALGALLRLQRWALAMEAALLVAAVIAMVQILKRRAVRQTLRNMAAIGRGWLSDGLQANPEINVNNPSMIRAPFGVAAAIGTLLAMVRPW